MFAYLLELSLLGAITQRAVDDRGDVVHHNEIGLSLDIELRGEIELLFILVDQHEQLLN